MKITWVKYLVRINSLIIYNFHWVKSAMHIKLFLWLQNVCILNTLDAYGFSFFVLWHINLCGLVNAKAIFVEEQ